MFLSGSVAWLGGVSLVGWMSSFQRVLALFWAELNAEIELDDRII